MINGIINVYKEKGFTSHDVVAKLRGILRQKKIGHTGTLDPEAEGVLPVCLGKATRVCDMLTEKDKVYEAFTWNCHRYPGYHRNRSVQASRNLLPGGGRKGHFVICW